MQTRVANRLWVLATFLSLLGWSNTSMPAAAEEEVTEPHRQEEVLTSYFFDVGQEDATLLRGPDFTILIDTGRHDREDVVPHLETAEVETIDLLIGTHPHADHIGQLPAVLDAFSVKEVWLSGDEHTTRTFERALVAILASLPTGATPGSWLRVCFRGDNLVAANVDLPETERVKQRVREKMERLRRRRRRRRGLD